ncbi:hypothetical protein ABQF34_20645 [Mycolicibacterium boenickei]
MAPVVRRPDPQPCGACARGEFDMCRNGRYTERGIKEIDGCGSELCCVPTEYAVRFDASLQRVGLLAALVGVQRGLDVHVVDRVTEGVKPGLVRDLGAAYHSEDIDTVAGELQPDVVIEATGTAAVVFGVLQQTSSYGITCLTGVSPSGRRIPVDAGALNREIVLENDVVIGSVNANLRHYRQATDILAAADTEWLERLITRQVPLEQAMTAFEGDGGDVKVVIELG